MGEAGRSLSKLREVRDLIGARRCHLYRRQFDDPQPEGDASAPLSVVTTVGPISFTADCRRLRRDRHRLFDLCGESA